MRVGEEVKKLLLLPSTLEGGGMSLSPTCLFLFDMGETLRLGLRLRDLGKLRLEQSCNTLLHEIRKTQSYEKSQNRTT